MSRAIFAFTLSLLVAIATGQEPPLPVATPTPATSPSARPELNIPDIPVEPSPLVPNAAPTPKKNLPSIQELDTAFQHSSLGAAVEEQRLHLEWRKLKNRVSGDPDVIAAKKAIDRAGTDLEKRDLRKAYYKMYYDRMVSIAEGPDVKAYVQQKENEIIASFAQPKTRPAPTARATPKP